jgi:hypothetical protein
VSRVGAAPVGSIKQLSIVFGEVIDILSTDRWHVVQSMHQVRSPESVGLGFRDTVPHHTHVDEGASSLVTEITDDCLARGILTPPVTTPAWMTNQSQAFYRNLDLLTFKLAIAVRVVAAKESSIPITVDDDIE